MPKALSWTVEQDATLLALFDQPGMNFRKAAAQLGVSRSFAQRRVTSVMRERRRATVTRDREDAGAAPLPAGHVIAWSAINNLSCLVSA